MDTVHGWIRENYGDNFLDDIAQLIFTFYRVILDSKILSDSEREALMNLLFEKMPNQNKISMKTKLLFRASEHDYDWKEFHKHCENKGPTVTIIHNEYDRVFGGYVTKSWSHYSKTYYEQVEDPTAFLFGIRPQVIYIPFKDKEEDSRAILMADEMGPMFGGGVDIALENKCNTSRNWASSSTFEFNFIEIAGGDDGGGGVSEWIAKDYEVFEILIK